MIEVSMTKTTAAPAGVVDDGIFSLETIEDHKVVEVPVDDTWKYCVLFESADFHTISVRLEPVIAGGEQYISGIGTVAGDAAVTADLLQRHPFFVICHHHCQTRGAAFQRLHLHDHRNFGNLSGDRLSDLSACLIHQ